MIRLSLSLAKYSPPGACAVMLSRVWRGELRLFGNHFQGEQGKRLAIPFSNCGLVKPSQFIQDESGMRSRFLLNSIGSLCSCHGVPTQSVLLYSCVRWLSMHKQGQHMGQRSRIKQRRAMFYCRGVVDLLTLGPYLRWRGGTICDSAE